MYVKCAQYPKVNVPVPGKENEQSVQFDNGVAKVSDAVGNKLIEGDLFAKIDKEEYDRAVAGSDMRHDLPQVHTKDGTLRHVPAAGELPNPMSKNDPTPDVLTDGANPSS